MRSISYFQNRRYEKPQQIITRSDLWWRYSRIGFEGVTLSETYNHPRSDAWAKDSF